MGLFDAPVPNFRRQATAPSSPATGAQWYDTTNELWKRWNGSAWVVSGGTTPKAVHVFGHSYAEGFGVSGFPSAPWQRYSARLAHRLGATEINHAVSGSQVNLPNASSTYRGLLARLNQMHNPGTVCTSDSPIELAIVNIGANDAGDAVCYSDTNVFSRYLRAAIQRLREVAIYEIESFSGFSIAQGTGGANWSTPSGLNAAGSSSGTGARTTQSVGNTFSFPLPASFQGGNVTFHGLINTGGGVVFDISVDGVAYGQWDSRLTVGSYITPVYYTLTGLAAGAHTITGTVSAVAGPLHVDYVGVEAKRPPMILLPQYMAAPTQPTGPGTHTPITTSDQTTFNGYIQSIAAEFTDGLVVYCPLTLSTSNAAYWISDNQHPSDLGHELIEAQLWTSLVKTGYLNQSRPNRAVSTDVTPRRRVIIDPVDPVAGTATLVAGAVTVSTRKFNANSKVHLTRVGTNANAGHLSWASVSNQTGSGAGSFTINSSSASDTSVIFWEIVDLIPT